MENGGQGQNGTRNEVMPTRGFQVGPLSLNKSLAVQNKLADTRSTTDAKPT